MASVLVVAGFLGGHFRSSLGGNKKPTTLGAVQKLRSRVQSGQRPSTPTDRNRNACGDPAGATVSYDGNTYDREGWDTFTKDQASGPAWSSSNPDAPVYTGDQGMSWTEYPDGWMSASSGSDEGYQPSTVQSVHDGVLDFYLHNDSNGHPVGANPSPLPGGNRYQTHGVYSECERVVPDAGSDLASFNQAPLLWPQNDADWQYAESDFPEGGLGGNLQATSKDAYAHYGGSGNQDSYSTGTFDATQWHVFTQTWTPSDRCYYIDDVKLGCSTNATYSGVERWQLQMQPSGTNDGGHGHVLVDWVWIGTSS